MAVAAREVLAERLSPAEQSDFVDAVMSGYQAERSALRKEVALGALVTVHLAALTANVYRSLVARGQSEVDARRLTASMAWWFYKRSGSLSRVVAKLTTTTPMERLQKQSDLLRHFPFQAPSYDVRDVDAGPGVVAFNMHRCPVADYFRSQGLEQVCVDAWCNLDLRLADQWGAQLDRSGTLVQGASHCDFRWRLLETPLKARDEP